MPCRWTDTDDAALAQLWPDKPWSDLEAAFPGRSYEAVKQRASTLGFKRQRQDRPETLERLRSVAKATPLRLGKLAYPIVDGCRVCRVCSESKPVELYYSAGGESGIRGECRTCTNKSRYARLKLSMAKDAAALQHLQKATM